MLRSILLSIVVLIGAGTVFAVSGSIAATLVALAVGLTAARIGSLALPSVVPAGQLGGGGAAAEQPADDPQSSEPLASEVVDAIAEPVLVVTDGTVTHANAAALMLLGEHILGEDARVALRHPGAAERLDGVDPQPMILAGLGGRERRWEMRVAVLSGNRRLVHLVDRSASHAAERTRVDFVANASHELRTPLASLLGYIETLRDPREPPTATRQRFLAIMEGEAKRMQRLIDDLISLSRIEAEQYRAPSGIVDLADLATQVCRERRDAHDGRGADLVVDRPDGPATVAGDEAQLSQLVHNLVGNAMKYGRAGTPVTIAVGRVGAMWRLSVADRGDGVAPEHLPRLTERFFRVDAGRSRSLGGTGLGLAIAKHVVERHRGRLDIDSIVGEGTTVSAMLPAVDRVGLVDTGASVTKGQPV